MLFTNTAMNQAYRIEFRESEVPAKASGYMDRLVREGMKIKLLPDSTNTEEGFTLSKAQNPKPGLLKLSNTHT